jgi:hypothetical protein
MKKFLENIFYNIFIEIFILLEKAKRIAKV